MDHGKAQNVIVNANSLLTNKGSTQLVDDL